jgi:hypothetical protein
MVGLPAGRGWKLLTSDCTGGQTIGRREPHRGEQTVGDEFSGGNRSLLWHPEKSARVAGAGWKAARGLP